MTLNIYSEHDISLRTLITKWFNLSITYSISGKSQSSQNLYLLIFGMILSNESLFFLLEKNLKNYPQ